MRDAFDLAKEKILKEGRKVRLYFNLSLHDCVNVAEPVLHRGSLQSEEGEGKEGRKQVRGEGR